jgi:NADH-quinone oxidoreductase subunit E
MLSSEEIREIEEEAALMPSRRSAAMEGLKVVQRHRGWVSDEALQDLSDYLKMSPADLDSIATFYSLIFRRQVGRHVILLCDSVSCWICGYEALLDAFREGLGIGFAETTADGRFTLLPVCCLGVCEHAPAIMIDRDVHFDVTPEGLPGILERYV